MPNPPATAHTKSSKPTYLDTADPPIINATSIINNNACGPGVVTTAIIDFLGREPESIVATNLVPAMIDALKHRVGVLGWHNVKALEMDSHALEFPDDMFTVSISNIDISTYKDPPQCLREMHRTLKTNGLAVVTIWKRSAAAELIHAAQEFVRADADLMKVPKAEFMQEGHLREMLAGAGFRDVVTKSVSVLCVDEEVEGLRGFMLRDFTRTVRAPWTGAEKQQWLEAVDRAIKDEVAKYGGVNFQAWIGSGRK